MITQTIQTILSLISDVVCFVFSARFINTVLFSFLFFVSIGAAEEKHGKNGKSKISKESKRYVQATNRKKGDKGISFVSTKERSKPSSGKWWILLVLGIGSFVYISKVQSTQSPTPAAEKVNSVIKKGFEFVQHLLADAVSVFQSLVAYGLPSASFLLIPCINQSLKSAKSHRILSWWILHLESSVLSFSFSVSFSSILFAGSSSIFLIVLFVMNTQVLLLQNTDPWLHQIIVL